MHKKYKADGFSIAAFPCNQFKKQEPGTNEEIKKFAEEKYGVTFDMYAKIDVNGDEADPLYKFLKDKQHGTLGNAIKWNFTKFLVDKEGKPVKRYGPPTAPFDIEGDIAKELGVAKK